MYTILMQSKLTDLAKALHPLCRLHFMQQT